MRAIVTCSVGMERLVRRELSSIGIASKPFVSPRKEVGERSGKIAVPSISTRQLYAANCFLRCANRIFVEAATFKATTLHDLELSLKRSRSRLSPFIPPASCLQVRCKSERSRLFHTAGIAERVHKLVGRDQPIEAASSQQVEVRALHDRFSLLVDSSGEALHERGWRDDPGSMPLRSTYAAAILMAAGWEEAAPASYLLDPCCGGGTIPIEAASMAIGLPPHAAGEDGAPLRPFALQAWPNFDHGAWASVLDEAKQRRQDALQLAESRHTQHGVRIWGYDRDAGAVAGATRNAVRAGVSEMVGFHHAPISQLAPPELLLRKDQISAAEGGASHTTDNPATCCSPLPRLSRPHLLQRHMSEDTTTPRTARMLGLLISNPPWGLRSSQGAGEKKGRRRDSTDKRPVYATLGRLFTERFAGWKLALLVKKRAHARIASKELEPTLELTIGGQRTWLMVLPNVGARDVSDESQSVDGTAGEQC